MKPQFETLQDFLQMGGYAPFVWAAWGLSIAVIIYLVASSMIGLARAKNKSLLLEKENDQTQNQDQGQNHD